MMRSAFVNVLIILSGSLLAGLALSAINITAEQILSIAGLNIEELATGLEKATRWALPHILVGSIVIVPIWLIVYLSRPPRR